MKHSLTPLTILVVCGLTTTATLAHASTDGGVIRDRGPYSYLYDYPGNRGIDDPRDPYAYLFERDVRASAKATPDGGPYAYLFDRDSDDRS